MKLMVQAFSKNKLVDYLQSIGVKQALKRLHKFWWNSLFLPIPSIVPKTWKQFNIIEDWL
jgi:hypothetical protein